MPVGTTRHATEDAATRAMHGEDDAAVPKGRVDVAMIRKNMARQQVIGVANCVAVRARTRVCVCPSVCLCGERGGLIRRGGGGDHCE